ncbi:M14 family metallopeptidase [Chitinophaga horti]|uniref:M14 family metallopeptidase n=1 Tax=Chitinophaga horti TaxID=2920382 RepID=A0ABY6IUN5_9BACT|nr:M14 metallopeptidase family protein [Chitinophaga horti]UYQ91085.1 M14 family metallopeptidase [Chitinophaga horti]
MLRLRSILALICLLSCPGSQVFAQAPPSPKEFLGYPLGSRFTPHYRVVEYFKQVAATSSQVKLEQYGQTYEGRPLLLAAVASPENAGRLEQIRTNNLQLAGIENGSGSVDQPGVVWLSYNVHGNEAVSTEAAMQTLYELVRPGNTQSQEWLRHTVVLIDPCLNPDGRDRYVNFYSATANKKPDANRFSREHREPWPSGRPNHYYFDLNRDWAWQTQVETQQRAVKYNQWMPQVHVDFHEQGIDEPYYFAPAAEPFHEIITPWQREFQVLIGKNNAKYFDDKGWRYFTKERFDLFYPSYGDTYPMYNGAIGMTYEQGGSGRAGLAVLTETGDTLTLADRIAHHYTTGMSTIEVTAGNAKKLLQEYQRYFTDARTRPAGDYRAYVVKSGGNPEKLASLAEMLRRNDIRFGYGAGTAKASGFNYFTGKTADFNIEANDLVINAAQPRGNFIKVLFEPESRLSDSVTYDITAWALPYAYGLTAYGVKQSLSPTSQTPPAAATTTAPAGAVYAYLGAWNSVADVKFLAALLQKGLKVRYAEEAFTVGSKVYPPGTLVVSRADNAEWSSVFDNTVSKLAATHKVVLDKVPTGFVEKGADLGSGKMRYIRKPNVALLAGNEVSSLGMGEIWHFFEQQIDYPVAVIGTEDFNVADLKDIDVLIMPDGYYSLFANKEAADRLRNWVSGGGKIVALEGAVAQIAAAEWGIKLKKEDDKKEEETKKNIYEPLRRYQDRERDMVRQFIPGAIYKVEMDKTHPLAFGYPDFYYTLKQNDHVYDFITDGGWNVGVIRKDNYLSGFVGASTKAKLKDGLLFGAKDLGRGQLVFMSDDPLFRSFWENGKLLFSNAVFLVGQ